MRAGPGKQAEPDDHGRKRPPVFFETATQLAGLTGPAFTPNYLMARSCFLRFILFSILCATVYSQFAVPPLQYACWFFSCSAIHLIVYSRWLNVTNLLQGSASPIPLSNAVIGYDPSTCAILIIPLSISIQIMYQVYRGYFRRGVFWWSSSINNIYVRWFALPNSFASLFLVSLDTQTLTWSSPVPPTGLTTTPSARSAAVSASDFAASKYASELS